MKQLSRLLNIVLVIVANAALGAQVSIKMSPAPDYVLEKNRL